MERRGGTGEASFVDGVFPDIGNQVSRLWDFSAIPAWTVRTRTSAGNGAIMRHTRVVISRFEAREKCCDRWLGARDAFSAEAEAVNEVFALLAHYRARRLERRTSGASTGGVRRRCA